MAARPDTLAELTNNELLRRYRFDRRCIEYLVGLLRGDLESSTARHISLSVSEKVLITFRFLATGEIQLNDGDLHHVAQSTVSKVVTAVINALISPAISRQFIFFPTTPADLDLQVQEFGGVAGFPKVVGVIDGTHVRIIAPSAEEEVNRKGFLSINVRVIFNACDKLVDIVARWPGSTHDSKILHNSGVKELFERGVVPAGYHLLGDSGYPSRRWLLSPYLYPQAEPQSSYNRAHKVTRAKVERGIGQLKRRFGILHGEIRTTPEKACRMAKQKTRLSLGKKKSTTRKPKSLSHWVNAVAYHIACYSPRQPFTRTFSATKMYSSSPKKSLNKRIHCKSPAKSPFKSPSSKKRKRSLFSTNEFIDTSSDGGFI